MNCLRCSVHWGRAGNSMSDPREVVSLSVCLLPIFSHLLGPHVPSHPSRAAKLHPPLHGQPPAHLLGSHKQKANQITNKKKKNFPILLRFHLNEAFCKPFNSVNEAFFSYFIEKQSLLYDLIIEIKLWEIGYIHLFLFCEKINKK